MTPPHPGPAPTLRALLHGLVDYAGLFPPAALSMDDAVAAYAGHLDAPESWMLGRFVVPVARLGELAAARARHASARSTRWRVSALAGADLAADIVAMRRAVGGDATLAIDVVEAKAGTPAAVWEAARAVGDVATLYAEVPIADDPRELIVAVREAGVRAKVRTGGLVPEAFPTAAQLARFIARCAEYAVPWKATAGLHHPLRAEHRLTYEPDPPHGTMFGFLNVFCAGAFARAGMPEPALARLLEERDAGALAFGATGLTWRGHALSLDELREARASFAIAFGSCSFQEPVADLHQLALL